MDTIFGAMTWELDPTIINIGSHGIRYYGVIFATGILLGYWFWKKQMARAGHDEEIADKFLVWGVLAVLIGSRLGHCLFYEPEYYLSHPWKILEVWKGGLASHGATIGLLFTIFLYARLYKFNYMEIMDRFAMSATMGAIFVRLGNFMNSEIVGKEWDGLFAVKFPRYALMNLSQYNNHNTPRLAWDGINALARHPSQLYEALGAFLVFVAIYLVDWRYKEERPRGLLAGMFLVGYFSFRFVVEFFKEFQSLAKLSPDAAEKVIHVLPTSGFTMGQYLSIPFVVLGLYIIVDALRKKRPASEKRGA